MSGIAPRYEVVVEGRDVTEDVSADVLSVSFEVVKCSRFPGKELSRHPGHRVSLLGLHLHPLW